MGALIAVGGNTVVSRVLGLTRDIVIARLFGAGSGADAFLVAFRIPNFLRRLFAEGAFSQAFVPVLSEYREKRDLAAVRDLIAHASGLLGAVVLILSILGSIAAPLLVSAFAPGYIGGEEGKLALAATMLRITFPYLLFISLTALAAGALNTYEHFGAPAFAPVLLNISMIGCAILLSPHLDEPVTALAWGVAIGGVAQLALQLPFLAHMGLLVRPRIARGHQGVSRILKLMLPAVFGASVGQINLLLDTLLASFLVTGSVTWLYFSDRLMEFPLGVFGVALATVILPRLSSEHSSDSGDAFSHTLDWALRWAVLIAIPASVGLGVLAGPLLTTMFQYGAFSGHDVHMASLSLMAYSIGLAGFIFVKILAPGYFSRQDIRTPVRIGIIAMAVNAVLNLLLIFPLAHAGLALATGISAMLNAGLLYRGLRTANVYRPREGWWKFIAAVAMAAVVMGVATYLYAGPIEPWLAAGLVERCVRLTIAVTGGGLVFALVAFLLGIRPHQLRRPGL
jgi:putative peptidoglycan lipid II flippase